MPGAGSRTIRMDTINNDNNISGASTGNIVIVYIDRSLLAVNKPAGLPTLPDGYNPQQLHLKSVLEPEYGRLWIIHRLDRETSGLVLLARTPNAHRSLNTQFEQRQVIKCYHALVCGSPDWQQKIIQLPLRVNGDRRHRTIIDPCQGKPAETEVNVLERFEEYAWVEASPHTGRTHQIRAHLAAINLPILGDTLYGGCPALYLSMLKPEFTAGIKAECPLIHRSALHAFSLDIIHPDSGQAQHLEAPAPKDLNAALRMLRRYSTQD